MEKCLTIDEVCDILRVKKHFIYALTSQKRIPFIKVGRFLRFRREEIDEWMKVNARKPEDIEQIKASAF